MIVEIILSDHKLQNNIISAIKI